MLDAFNNLLYWHNRPAHTVRANVVLIDCKINYTGEGGLILCHLTFTVRKQIQWSGDAGLDNIFKLKYPDICGYICKLIIEWWSLVEIKILALVTNDECDSDLFDAIVLEIKLGQFQMSKLFGSDCPLESTELHTACKKTI